MMRWSCGVPLRVGVVEVESRGVWLELESESFVTRYLLPHSVAVFLGRKLAQPEVGTREIPQDDLMGL